MWSIRVWYILRVDGLGCGACLGLRVQLTSSARGKSLDTCCGQISERDKEWAEAKHREELASLKSRYDTRIEDLLSQRTHGKSLGM